MRRSPVLVAALTVLSVCAPAPAGAATTRTVDPVAGPYTTITDALHAADPGDTIDIHEGHYDEQLWVDKDDLTLRAAPGTIVSSTAPFVISLMGARDTLDGLFVAGGAGGVRIEGMDARLLGTTVLADDTGVSVKGAITTRIERTQLRATGLTGTALLARNDAPDPQKISIATAILVGGREGTAMDVLSGAVGDTAPVGSLRVELAFATVAGAPTALRSGQAGNGPVPVVAPDMSIVHGDAPGMDIGFNETDRPDALTFRNPAALDFHLRADVPKINTIVLDHPGAETDLDGLPRSLGGYADPGAYEFVDTPPAAALVAAATTVGQGVAASFDASGSADPDPGGQVVSYFWSFGDGTPPITTTAPTIAHAFAAVGHPVVTVRVADQQHATATSAPIAMTVVDALAPALRLTAPADRARLHRYRTVRRHGRRRHVVNVLRFAGRATDAGGVARVEVTLAQRRTKAIKKPVTVTGHATLDGAAWSWRTSSRKPLPAGSYTLTARAVDRAGNVSTPGVLHFTVT